MSLSEILFFVIGALAVLSALGVVLHPHPVYSALALVVTLFQVALLFLVLDAQTIAFLQVIVYAGAIMVLFLFVIMLLNLQRESAGPPRAWLGVVTAVGALLMAELLVLLVAGGEGTTAAALPEDFGTIEALSRTLFTEYVLAFEVTSILLLVAVIGAVVLAKKETRGEA
jgi:NADH-quinone oxidoreductase subunit J